MHTDQLLLVRKISLAFLLITIFILANMTINTLEPSQVLKIGLADSNPRSGTTTSSKRTHNRSMVPVLDNSIISSQDFKIVKR